MVIEIAKDEVVPERRRSEAYPADPVIRRMRWGSLKSRSYDHPADRSRPRHPSASSLASRHAPFQPANDHYSSSLERREHSMPASARYPYDQRGQYHQATGSLSARSGRGYGYASTSGGYEHRRLSASERDGYDQPAREHRDSYPSMKPARISGGGGPPPGDYYGPPRRAPGDWRDEGRGGRPPDQYDYSVDRGGGELPPQQPHYSGDSQDYGGSRELDL
uniref:Uncharacterized protein n=1 Tax=Ditylenchus dipsaci TaxID=166011 RepID=A0A915EPU1_9BILA